MKDKEIDEILDRAARVPHPVDPALLDRVATSMGETMRPVRPLPPAGFLESGLFLICASVAGIGAARLGFFGVRALSTLESASIFSVLVILIWLTAATSVSEMIPGSRRRITPVSLLLLASASLPAVFALLFRDYRTVDFVHQGVICLIAGLLHAVPAALASWLLLRRGYAVNPLTFGLAAGTLSGLAGVTMLELHCANLQTLHQMLWHTAVLPLSALGGAWVLRAQFGRAAAPRD